MSSVSATKKARDAETLPRSFCKGTSTLQECLSNAYFSRKMTSPWPTSWSFKPQTVLIGGCFAAGRGGPLSRTHAGRRLKNIRRERTTVHVKFHPQIPRVGNPGNLVAFFKHYDLRDQSNQYGAFSHFLVAPCGSGAEAPVLSVLSDDSIFQERILVSFVTGPANFLLEELNFFNFYN